MQKLFLSLIILFLSIGVIYYFGVRGTYKNSLSINSNTFWVQVVNNDRDRQLGLSGRYGMCAKCGMLFEFSEERDNRFWMKDMKFDLDMIFIDSNKQIVSIAKSVKKESYPNIITSELPSQYVLELNAGEVDKLDIKLGDVVKW